MRRPPSLPTRSLAVALLTLAVPAFAVDPAHATAEERAAARELFKEGVALQSSGDFAGALDRFSRAQTLIDAPTHLLHIAQCQRALGKLVEATESYRALGTGVPGAAAPPAFLQAQAQGKEELAALEPRVPKLRLVVTAPGAKGVVAVVDDEPWNALIGVAVPTNPGPHAVVVTAPGFATARSQVTLVEGETKEHVVTLAAEEPRPAPAPAPMPLPYVGVGPVGVVPGGVVPVVPGDAPPPEPAPIRYAPARGGLGAAPGAFVLGVGLDATALAGTLLEGSTVGDHLGAGVSVGVEAGARFARRFYAGGLVRGTLFPGTTVQPAFGSAISSTTTTGESAEIGGRVGWLSNPRGFGVLGEAGASWVFVHARERLRDTVDLLNPNAGPIDAEYGTLVHGPSLHIGAGVTVRASPRVRIVPKVTLTFSRWVDLATSCTSVLEGSCTRLSHGPGTLPSGAATVLLHFGIAGEIEFTPRR